MNALSAVARRELALFSQNRILTASVIIFPALLALVVVAAAQRAPAPTALLVHDQDRSEESAEFMETLADRGEFKLQEVKEVGALELLGDEVRALLTIPEGWGSGLSDGEPLPLQVAVNAIHPEAARRTQRALQETLRFFQQERLETIILELPEAVVELAKQVPLPTRRHFVSWMAPWTVEAEYLYNATLREADYVIPGAIGLVVQFFAVPLMALAFVREFESGVTARRSEIVFGKALAHCGLWAVAMAVAIAAAYIFFPTAIQRPFAATLPVITFLAATLGIGALIGSLSRTSAAAVVLSLIYLIPAVAVAGVFEPVWQLPRPMHVLAHLLPLTYFAGAFRDLTMLLPRFPTITGDLVMMLAIAGISFAAAILLLPVKKTS